MQYVAAYNSAQKNLDILKQYCSNDLEDENQKIR